MKSFYITLLIIAFSVPGVRAQQTVGLFRQDTASESGYVLFGPMLGKTTFLIDKCGKKINTWGSAYAAGASCYLLPDGSLLRPGNYGNPVFNSGGEGGIIERKDWSGASLWSYVLSSPTECQHHDICPLPNGNVLAVVWDKHSPADAAGNGRNPAATGPSVWSEKIVELKPDGATGADIVWEWRVWDHLVQNLDPNLPGYGLISGHPELVDVNYLGHGQAMNPDWLHVNSVAYNAQLDQIVLSSYFFDEIWIVDHSTTTAEAASHSGGTYGHGGDLLYRWGNPEAYGRGTPADHILYSPHNPQWIPQGYPGAGHITIYNNGAGRPGGDFSTAEEIVTPLNTMGTYTLALGQPYGPSQPAWRYKAPNPTDFFSPTFSSVQRLQGGNTLIAEGKSGVLFEVNSAGKMLWRYVNPANAQGIVAQGSNPGANSAFRATQYYAGYAAFAGRTLTPGAPVELSPLAYNCYFKTTSPAHTTGVYGGPAALFAEAINPASGPELRIRPAEDVTGAQLVLLNALGQRCAAWNTDLHSGEWSTLPLPGNVAAGHYTLHLSTLNGTRSSLTIIRQ